MQKDRSSNELPVLAALAVAALLPLPSSLPAAEPPPATEAAQQRTAGTASAAPGLPLTIERVWYRTGRKGALTGGTRSGDLSIDEEALTFATRKREFVIPLETVRTLSYGKMRGDVDTDWVVLSVESEQGRSLVGLRDGRKFGYGQATAEIHETLRTIFRRLGVAQYDVPEGFETYDRMADQYVLALPAGWAIHPRTLTEVGDQAIWGALVFSPRPLAPDPSLPPDEREAALRRSLHEVDSGRSGAIFMQRRKAKSGMRCRGFSDKAVETIVAWAAQDRIFAGTSGVDESTRTESIDVDVCSGLRVLKRVRDSAGSELILDLRAASDDDTVFLFGLRSRAGRIEGDLETFETVMRSVRFSVARRDPL
jgi:hypothetical protein